MTPLPASPAPLPGRQRRPARTRQVAVAAANAPALLAFVALFPGYFVYHALVAQGLPPLLRGYSVLMAALALPLLALGGLRHLAAGQATVWIDTGFAAFMACVLAGTLVHLAAGDSPEIVTSYLSTVPQWLALYGVARLNRSDDPRFVRACRASWWLMSAIVLANVTEGSFIVAVLDSPVGDRDTLATYQDFALLYLVVTLALLAGSRSMWTRWPLMLASAVVLFLTGARSEFLALLVGAAIIAWSLSRRRLALVVLAAVLAAAAAASLETVVDLLPGNRVVDLIANRAEGSLSERGDMLRQAWLTIGDHPVGGRFGSYQPGEYAHNLLSAWVDFGIAGLTALLLLLLLPLLDLAAQFGRRSRQPAYVLVLTLLLLAVLLLATAKTFTYNLVPFALGAYALDLARRTRRRRGDAPVP